MRKIKEVLRLRFELGLGLRAIARSCSIGLGTAHEYLQRAEVAGVTWPLGEDWDEDRLEAALFGGPPHPRPAELPMTDFAELHRQRQRHPHLTQQLLWEEYRQANPDGYRYSRFCGLYQRWRRKQDVVLRQEHKAGEKLFVDWAGDTIPIHDPRGGPIQQAHLFVAVLGASSYTYAEATADEQLASWIGAHVRAFEFFRGTPKLVVPDNTKTGVTKACRYDPDLNPTYQEMAMHYGIGVDEAEHFSHNQDASVAALRGCSGLSRNAVRIPFGIIVRLRRNPHTYSHARMAAMRTAVDKLESRLMGKFDIESQNAVRKANLGVASQSV